MKVSTAAVVFAALAIASSPALLPDASTLVAAQQSASEPSVPRRAEPAPRTPASAALDVDRLPIDLQRIERQLRQAGGERAEFEGLRLRYFVDVYGKAPRIELFAPDENLNNGPVPWGGPTHRQMLEIMTPKEFRSPPMDLSALMRWLAEKAK
jgi:hypothetical protein